MELLDLALKLNPVSSVPFGLFVYLGVSRVLYWEFVYESSPISMVVQE